MTLRKTAAGKRAHPPRRSDYTKAFLKDWERLSRSGRYNMNQLKEAMLLLIANEGPLGPEWRDHALVGDWDGHRECHIGGDFLLAYKLDEDGTAQQIIFVVPEHMRTCSNNDGPIPTPPRPERALKRRLRWSLSWARSPRPTAGPRGAKTIRSAPAARNANENPDSGPPSQAHRRA
jgi:mRNA interferase YafQ